MRDVIIFAMAARTVLNSRTLVLSTCHDRDISRCDHSFLLRDFWDIEKCTGHPMSFMSAKSNSTPV